MKPAGMRWEKIGLLFEPEVNHPKLLTHAANPLAIHLYDDVFRIFYSGRDVQNRSSVGYVDLDILKHELVYVHNKPVFEYGKEGSFYSHGVSIGDCYEIDGQKFLLFMGWQRRQDEHWRGEIGRLVLDSDFDLHIDNGKKPFVPVDDIDLMSLSYPCVIKYEKQKYFMWYGSTITWDAGNGEMLHVINYAESIDGHTWQQKGLSIPFASGVAQAFSRPTVIGNSSNGYHMWFSFRSGSGEKYRIGYAFSQNCKIWSLDLELSGIDVSSSGWDSEMICYPYVFEHKGNLYMLYNGNNYGKTGFGLAVLDQSELCIL